MQPMIKRLLSIILLLAGVQAGWSFALLGPIGNGGDSWQTATIGYGLVYTESIAPGGPVFLGDIGAPKNFAEGYRRNTPTVYYAYDANFLGFFGSDGATAADGAFAIMNNLTNVSSYSTDLSEFPDVSQSFNFEAQSLFLTDIKSVTLHLLVETMGLATPERFTWTLSERFLPSGGKCPIDEEYQVLQRNFALSPTSTVTTEYSPYVNDVLYSYLIEEFCTGPNPLAITIPYTADPLQQAYTAVAANDNDGSGRVFISGNNFILTNTPSLNAGGGLQIGGYYRGLTRDDVAGLRYLYRAGNIVTEDAAAGSLLFSTNVQPFVLVQTFSFGQLISDLTNDPASLQTNFPGLVITSVTTNFILTNITILTPTFTNFPGASITNFAAPILFSNIDLTLFNVQSTTNPTALQALYPQLDITSSALLGFQTILIPNLVTYLTNAGFGSPANNPPIVKTVTNGFTPIFIEVWTNTFGNLFTNTFSTNSKVTIQTVTITNFIGAPAGTIVTNITTKNTTLTNTPSGDLFIIPTNWCGFFVLQKLFQQKVPSFTNSLIATPVTNALGAPQVTRNEIFFFTNRVWAIEPGVCEPTLIFQTNTVNEIVTNFQFTFGNLFTNLPTLQSTNSQVTIIITNIGPCSNGMAGTLCTNITTTSFTETNVPSGDFFIIPTNWTCGFSILSIVSTNSVGTTNTITTLVPPGVTNAGQQFSVTTISFFTNHTLQVQPFICQTATPVALPREGIERVQFVRANFDALIGQFFQPITNLYSAAALNQTNGQRFVENFQRIITAPDILLSADNQIAANTFDGTVTRNINFDTANVGSGLAGPGVINGPVTFDYNKIGAASFNGTLASFGFTTNQFLSEQSAIPLLAWASYDGTTNAPEVYPNGNSISNLESQIEVQISPTSLPNGFANVAYPPVTLTMSGGAFIPPFNWTASNLPAGMTLSSNGILFGTPTQSGVYDVSILVMDSQNRSVTWFYRLIIQ